MVAYEHKNAKRLKEKSASHFLIVIIRPNHITAVQMLTPYPSLLA